MAAEISGILLVAAFATMAVLGAILAARLTAASSPGKGRQLRRSLAGLTAPG